MVFDPTNKNRHTRNNTNCITKNYCDIIDVDTIGKPDHSSQCDNTEGNYQYILCMFAFEDAICLRDIARPIRIPNTVARTERKFISSPIFSNGLRVLRRTPDSA